MIKKSMALILTLLLLAIAGPIAGEEMAREGSSSGKTYWTGTFDVLPMGKERVQMNYVGYSVVISDTKKDFTHLASGHVVGGLLAVKGVYKNDSGMMSFTRPDGDRIFATYKCSGTLGKNAKGTYTIVGGTGKFVGITGTGEFTRHSLRPPPKEFLQASAFKKPLGNCLKRSKPDFRCFIYGRVRNGSAFFNSQESVSKRFSLFKVKEGENFNQRNTLSISRIKI